MRNGPSSLQAESTGLPCALARLAARGGGMRRRTPGPSSSEPRGPWLRFIFAAPVPEVVVVHSRHLINVSCVERIQSSCSSSKPCTVPSHTSVPCVLEDAGKISVTGAKAWVGGPAARERSALGRGAHGWPGGPGMPHLPGAGRQDQKVVIRIPEWKSSAAEAKDVS